MLKLTEWWRYTGNTPQLPGGGAASTGSTSDLGSKLVEEAGGGSSCISLPVGGSAGSEVARSASADSEPRTGTVEVLGAVMASSGMAVSTSGSANEAPEVPDNVGDWLRGVYRFATDRNDFRRNLILNLGLFAAGVWLARNLSDIDLMAPQPGV